jgi:hypothetical protein
MPRKYFYFSQLPLLDFLTEIKKIALEKKKTNQILSWFFMGG